MWMQQKQQQICQKHAPYWLRFVLHSNPLFVALFFPSFSRFVVLCCFVPWSGSASDCDILYWSTSRLHSFFVPEMWDEMKGRANENIKVEKCFPMSLLFPFVLFWWFFFLLFPDAALSVPLVPITQWRTDRENTHIDDRLIERKREKRSKQMDGDSKFLPPDRDFRVSPSKHEDLKAIPSTLITWSLLFRSPKHIQGEVVAGGSSLFFFFSHTCFFAHLSRLTSLSSTWKHTHQHTSLLFILSMQKQLLVCYQPQAFQSWYFSLRCMHMRHDDDTIERISISGRRSNKR